MIRGFFVNAAYPAIDLLSTGIFFLCMNKHCYCHNYYIEYRFEHTQMREYHPL